MAKQPRSRKATRARGLGGAVFALRSMLIPVSVYPTFLSGEEGERGEALALGSAHLNLKWVLARALTWGQSDSSLSMLD